MFLNRFLIRPDPKCNSAVVAENISIGFGGLVEERSPSRSTNSSSSTAANGSKKWGGFGGGGSGFGGGGGGLLIMPKLRVSSRRSSKKSSNEVFRSNSFKFERYERLPPQTTQEDHNGRDNRQVGHAKKRDFSLSRPEVFHGSRLSQALNPASFVIGNLISPNFPHALRLLFREIIFSRIVFFLAPT
jgi:hypothetical protein